MELDDIADLPVWQALAVNPDNTPRYALRGESRINDAIQNALLDVVNQEQALPAAVENIQRVVQSILDEEHSR